MKKRRPLYLSAVILVLVLFAGRMCYEMIQQRRHEARQELLANPPSESVQLLDSIEEQKPRTDSLANVEKTRKKKSKQAQKSTKPVPRDFLNEPIADRR